MRSSIQRIGHTIRTHPLLIALCCLADLTFFFSVSLLLTQMVLSVKEHVEGVYRLMSTDLGQELTKEAMQLLLSQQDVLMSHYYQIMTAVGWFVLGIMIAWIVLQGASWCIAHKLSASKLSPKTFAQRFVLISIAGLILIVAVFVISVRLTILRTQMVLPLYSDQATNIVVTLLFAIVAYIIMTSLGLIAHKNWYKMIWTRAIDPLKTALPFVLIGATIVGLNWLTLRSLAGHWLLFGALALLVVLPSYTVGRMVWISRLTAD